MNVEMKRMVWVAAQAVLALTVAGCGGADAPADELAAANSGELSQAERLRWKAVDSLAPAVSIMSTSAVAANGSVELSGEASDNLRLYRVRWTNDKGGSGAAALSGTTTAATWSVPSIALQTGDNTITVIAEDAAGNTAQVVQVVTRTQAPPTYSAVVTWSPPSLNTDGSALSDMVGFRVYYGTSPTSLPQSAQVSGATTTSTTISGLPSGTYYFRVAALNAAGVESALTNPVSVVNP